VIEASLKTARSVLTRSVLALSACLCGCEQDQSVSESTETQLEESTVDEGTDDGIVVKRLGGGSSQLDQPTESESHKSTGELVRKGTLGQSDPKSSSTRSVSRDARAVVGQLGLAIEESLDLGPVLVVWIFDRSENASDLVRGVRGAASQFYSALGESDSLPNPLSTAVVTFTTEPQFLMEEPSSDRQKIIEVIDDIDEEPSSHTSPFDTLSSTIEKYSEYRREKRWEVFVVLVTDTQGNETSAAQQAIQLSISNNIPLYASGYPAPFGRRDGGGKTNSTTSIPFGPESCQLERIALDLPKQGFDSGGLDLMESGFGPWALESVCRASGGRFMAVTPSFGTSLNGWPSSSARQFDPDVMRRYAPDYGTVEEYNASVAASSTKTALVTASKMSRVQVLEYPNVEFAAGDEARMVTALSNAQKLPARLTPSVAALVDVLKGGERERGDVKEARWRAGYDLAYGRSLASQARIEGYNSMLASMKRGRIFEDPKSTHWSLESTDEIEGSSLLKNKAKKARSLLQQIVSEHPQTPWAAIAQYELSIPMGWKWTEIAK